MNRTDPRLFLLRPVYPGLMRRMINWPYASYFNWGRIKTIPRPVGHIYWQNLCGRTSPMLLCAQFIYRERLINPVRRGNLLGRSKRRDRPSCVYVSTDCLENVRFLPLCYCIPILSDSVHAIWKLLIGNLRWMDYFQDLLCSRGVS